MNIWERLKRWHQTWPEGPVTYDYEDTAAHHCLNCDHDYTGDYCPCCGQYSGVGRFTWKSLMSSFFELWDFTSRSALNTLLQLFYRPGYLISDYINGRRTRYFQPIKLLVVVGLFVVVGDQLFFSGSSEEGNTEFVQGMDQELEEGNFNAQQDKIMRDLVAVLKAGAEWSEENQGWAMLLICSLLILPTRYLFRRAPRHGKHNIPEGFILQAYICSPLLVCTFFDKVWNIFGLLALFILYLTYYQFFGYGKWTTIWRTSAVLAISIGLIILLLILFGTIFIVHELT